MTPLEILYRDAYLVAINKPSGLLVHRSLIDKRETRFAIQLLRDQIGQRVYPLHRLDKPTSGVLLFALSSDVARDACELFRHNRVDKTYLGVVRGWPEESGRIDYPLREEQDRTTDGLADSPSVKDAITDFRTLARVELPVAVGRYPSSRYAMVLAHPRTGRKHQIRRHLAHLRHPLVGDTTHGDGRHNRFFREEFDCHRLLLHAWRSRLPHPVTKVPITLEAPLDGDFEGLLKRWGWDRCLPLPAEEGFSEEQSLNKGLPPAGR